MHPIIDVPLGVAIDQDLQWLIMRMQSVCLSKVSTERIGDCSVLLVCVLGLQNGLILIGGSIDNL